MWQYIKLVYFLINFCGFIPIILGFAWPVDLYYSLRERYNLVGTLIPLFLLAIIFWPMAVISAVVAAVIFIGSHICDWVRTIWDKLFARKDV